MTQSFRIAGRGICDTSQSLGFQFDGRRLEGHPGDTLASALLANGVHLVGRSFKYHRPRGVLTAGSAEPNALVELRSSARREPNTRATQIELYDGLSATSQNRGGSLKFDLMAGNQLFGSAIAAGFYYKTFMWPAAFWERVYEPLIRRAAGLGRAARVPDPDHYEHSHAHCDVLVVGAGAAGIMAALAAGRAGARVILADENPLLGGTLIADAEAIGGKPPHVWLAEVEAELLALPAIRLLRRTTVFGYYEHNVLGAIERANDHFPVPPPHQPRQRLWMIRARQVVIAAGAQERPIVFANNDRPGIMLASAVRAYLNRWGVTPGRRVAIATNNDDAYRTAAELAKAGVEVAAIIDARRQPGPVSERVRALGIEVVTEAVPVRAHGGHRVTGLEFKRMGSDKLRRVACDCLAMSGGFDPAVHLSSQAGSRPNWHEPIQAFVPGTPRQDLHSAGACRGVFALADCLQDGLSAGRQAAAGAGHDSVNPPLRAPQVQELTEAPIEALWEVTSKGKAFVDFQNDVTARDIRLAAREGYVSVEHAKRYTTLGMGTDQGKTSNVVGLAVLAAARKVAIPDVGTTTFRPPYTPVAIGSFAGHHRGRSFQPIRRTAVHRWHERNGAVFVEAGQWLRPRYYERERGEGLMAACTREARQVRQSVGLCDVSTLGRIEIFGPDAAEFLNRLYINGWSTLKVMRARYGIMLREDGHVFDDGTASRLADDHYLMTTTTANAAHVLAHMEHYAQCVWPDLDVCFCTATEQWCGMALAGPRARQILRGVVDDADVSNEALPFMGVVEATAGGAPVRIFRISFSGELAYEINTPWGHGEALWERCMGAGQSFGIVPYGTEALGILRIEKGHPAGPEIDGRTTAIDIGAGRMMSTKKHYVGLSLSQRPGLADPDRPRLVGVKPTNEGDRLRGGAHIVGDPRSAGGPQSLGWLSSVHWSPAMDQWIGLGFVRGGFEGREGQRLWAVYPLRDEEVRVDICEPCFVDPEGTRLRA